MELKDILGWIDTRLASLTEAKRMIVENQVRRVIKPKRTMSAAAREKISAAQRKRWRRQRKTVAA
jgi:hypothetical protein